MRVVMIGAGYAGLTTGLGFTQLGHHVACVDVDARKIAQLDLGQVPFFEPGAQEVLRSAQERGDIVFTTDLGSVIGNADVIMLTVGTPPSATGEADLQYIYAAAQQIGSVLEHEAVVVVKSTVPVGTTKRVAEIVRAEMDASGRGDLAPLIGFAMVPEFLREGTALEDFLEPDRLVFGVNDSVTGRIMAQLHEGIQAPVAVMSIESAELTKYAANAMLATKISFINEIANIAERTGADVRDVARAIGMDKRIGPHFLRAGVGYGGSCFPKDVSALNQLAGKQGYDFKLLSSVIEVNNRQRDLFFQKICRSLGSVRRRRIGVWGLAFKPGTDDVRESVGIDLARRLFAAGADVQVYDPKAMETARECLHEAVVFAPTAIDAAEGVDALVVVTEWPEFKEVSLSTLRSVMLEPVIFDGRNYLVDLPLGDHGFSYTGIGIGE